MPARWQQWMPFRIDAFKGSPAVQAMHPCARIGYLYLLACCWQTEDCSISTDTIELAEKSGLGDELWTVHGPRILRKFEAADGNGRLRNPVLFAEWMEAKRVFDARRQAAERTTEIRSPRHKATVTVEELNGHRTVTDGGPSRSADTHTRTGTGTVVQEQKPSRAKSARGAKTEAAKSRHAEFKSAISRYWESKNPGIEMPWGPAEGKNLEMWLREAPTTTLDQFKGFLRNRYKSEVNHTERPSRWIGSVTGYANGPLDRFGKPLNGGKSNGAIASNLEILNQSLNGRADQGGFNRNALLSRGADESAVFGPNEPPFGD